MFSTLLYLSTELLVEGVKKELKLSDLSQEGIESMIKLGMDQLFRFAVNVLLAIIVYIIGRWLIDRLWRFFRAMLDRKGVDPSLKIFLQNVVKITFNILLIITIVGILGVETSSFVALFASAGVGIGMAMSGTLQNFAAGVFILLQKPYKIGDVVEISAQTGLVKEIQIFSTVITTFDNKVIYIPNGQIANGVINNYTKAGKRRVEWIFGIAYGNDVDKAKELLYGFLEEDSRVLSEPVPPLVALHKLNNSSVDLIVRAWTTVDDFWLVYWEMNEKVYKQFDKNGLSIPFPQMDVHIKQS